jgi:polysaccharide export outer membrane protein
MSSAANFVPGPQRLGALDKVKVTVFQSPELSGEFQVDSSGKIDFPLIGAVGAQGKTTEELRQILASRLSEKYLQNPNVQISLTSQNEQLITVDGSVNGPGVFSVKGPTTLMRAVAMAKGAAPDANISRVIVFRTINGERMAGAFDLAAIRKAQAEDPLVYGNDIVIVDGNRAQRLFSTLMGSLPLLSVLRPY